MILITKELRCAVAMTMSLACSLAFAQAVQTQPLTKEELNRTKEIITKDDKPKGPVQVDPQQGRVTVENKSGLGGYAEGHSTAPSKDNPKGGKEVGAGITYRFGGSSQTGNGQPAQQPDKSAAAAGQKSN